MNDKLTLAFDNLENLIQQKLKLTLKKQKELLMTETTEFNLATAIADLPEEVRTRIKYFSPDDFRTKTGIRFRINGEDKESGRSRDEAFYVRHIAPELEGDAVEGFDSEEPAAE